MNTIKEAAYEKAYEDFLEEVKAYYQSAKDRAELIERRRELVALVNKIIDDCIAEKPDNKNERTNSVWLAYYEIPRKLHDYVDALINISGYSEDFFEVTDKELAKRLGKSTKSIQRYRNALTEWQTQHKIHFIEIIDSYNRFDKAVGVVAYHPHSYRIHFKQKTDKPMTRSGCVNA